MSVECKIPSLKLAAELLPYTSPLEESLVHLEQLDEQRQDALVSLEVNKCHVKAQYDNSIHQGRLVKENWSFYGINRKNPWA